MASDSLHERFDDLTPETRDLHRAIVSLMEELEAIDWYQQRTDATQDEELRAVLAHNRDEEIEHAMMNLEWIRRRNAKVDESARIFLFSEGPITEVEEAMKAEKADSEPSPQGSPPNPRVSSSSLRSSSSTNAEADAVTKGSPSANPNPSGPTPAKTAAPSDGSLGIGSLKLT